MCGTQASLQTCFVELFVWKSTATVVRKISTRFVAVTHVNFIVFRNPLVLAIASLVISFKNGHLIAQHLA